MQLEQEHIRLLERDEVEALQLVEKVVPVPSVLLSILVVYEAAAPWATGVLVVAYNAFNICLTQLGIHRRGLPQWLNELRYAINAPILFAVSYAAGPTCPGYLLAISSVCGAPFVFRDWHAWPAVISVTMAAIGGTYAAGGAFEVMLLMFLGMLSFGVVIAAAVIELRRRSYELSKAMVSLQHASRVKEDFLAMMSHEIRTPLHGLVGASALLRSAQGEVERDEILYTLHQCSDEIARLTTEILEFSKLQDGALEPESVLFDVRALVATECHAGFAAARARPLTCTVTVDPRVAAWYQGDAKRIAQVLRNLVNNAVTFTARGSVEVRVAPAAGGLRFEVQDTGTGIAEADLATLFSAFSRLDRPMQSQRRGAGMGLAICKRVVEALGGELGVTSEPGVGSLFWFTVPCHAPDAENETGAPLSSACEPASAALLPAEVRVLVVDDNAINRQVLVGMLQNLGFSTEIAVDGDEAVRRSAEEHFPVILMDCHMPKMDGYEAARLIRAREGARSRIIGITANALPGDRERCLDAGMDEYMAKPVGIDLLRARMHAALATLPAPT